MTLQRIHEDKTSLAMYCVLSEVTLPVYVQLLLLLGRKATERVDSAGCISNSFLLSVFGRLSVSLPQSGLGENP